MRAGIGVGVEKGFADAGVFQWWAGHLGQEYADDHHHKPDYGQEQCAQIERHRGLDHLAHCLVIQIGPFGAADPYDAPDQPEQAQHGQSGTRPDDDVEN